MNETSAFIPEVGKQYKNLISNTIIEVLCVGSKTCYVKVVQCDENNNLIGYEYTTEIGHLTKYYMEYKKPISISYTVALIKHKKYKTRGVFTSSIKENYNQLLSYYDHMGYDLLSAKHITLTEGEFDNE